MDLLRGRVKRNECFIIASFEADFHTLNPSRDAQDTTFPNCDSRSLLLRFNHTTQISRNQRKKILTSSRCAMDLDGMHAMLLRDARLWILRFRRVAPPQTEEIRREENRLPACYDTTVSGSTKQTMMNEESRSDNLARALDFFSSSIFGFFLIGASHQFRYELRASTDFVEGSWWTMKASLASPL